MKKILITVSVISLVLLPSVAFAENPSTSTKIRQEDKRETIRDQVEAKKETLHNQIEERRDTALLKIKERISDIANKIIVRFGTAIERLGKLADRIESRIAKMEAGGIDVVKAKELLAIARAKIETAKTSISEISLPLTNVVSDTSSTTSVVKEKYNLLRTEITKAKEDIKTAHAALVDVIRNLKPGANKERRGEDSQKATSTATTTKDSAGDDNN